MLSTSVATLRLDSLEIARGHDGLLRGAPEPVILLALFGCRPGAARLLDRRVVHVRPPRVMPCTLRPMESVMMAPMLAADETHALIVAVGIERDGGRDVERIFGALEHCERLSAWCPAEHDPSPRHIEEVAATSAGRTLRAALLVDGTPIEDGTSDDVVGASLTSLDATAPTRRDARFALVSADGRNDWTALARVGLRARPVR